MKIYLDDKKLDSKYGDLTLFQTFKKVKENIDGKIIKKVFINNVEVNQKYLKESLIKKEDIKQIKFITQKTNILIKNTLEEANIYLPKLKDGISKVVSDFRSGNKSKANNLYHQIIDGFEWYTDAINKIISIVNNENLFEKNKELVQQLNENLTDLMIAYNKQDYILVADIFEYEILDIIDEFLGLNNKLLRNFETEGNN